MNFLVIGKGGREHAIGRALSQSPSVKQVYAAPGSQGMGEEIKQVACDLSSEALYQACNELNIDVVVIGLADTEPPGPVTGLVADAATTIRLDWVLPTEDAP